MRRCGTLVAVLAVAVVAIGVLAAPLTTGAGLRALTGQRPTGQRPVGQRPAGRGLAARLQAAVQKPAVVRSGPCFITADGSCGANACAEFISDVVGTPAPGRQIVLGSRCSAPPRLAVPVPPSHRR